MKTLNILCAIFGAFTMMLTSVSNAASIMYTGNGFNDLNNGATLGFQFSPVVDLTVTSLGVFDGGVDGAGLQTARDVGLYTDTGVLLASASVDNADPLINGFRFTTISPLVLNAAQTYVLAAYYTAGASGQGDKVIATTLNSHPLITLTSHILGEGGASLTFPTVTVSLLDFSMTANMLFTPVPCVGNGTDSDSDGVDDNCDNCTATSNAAQIDTDGDGHGNACDGDFQNNCATNIFDLFAFKAAFGSSDPADAQYDMNSTGGPTAVNIFDLFVFKVLFGLAPGPSAPGALCP